MESTFIQINLFLSSSKCFGRIYLSFSQHLCMANESIIIHLQQIQQLRKKEMIQARSNEESTVGTKINLYFLTPHVLSLCCATSIITTIYVDENNSFL